MSVGGLILMGCILTIFVVFSAVLAWGVHQTNSLDRDKSGATPSTTQAATSNKRAA